MGLIEATGNSPRDSTSDGGTVTRMGGPRGHIGVELEDLPIVGIAGNFSRWR